ncbi:ABC transporter permease [Neobacillus mesonae]|nr:ABC transporter permease [Neobacillus mesonae]
MNKVSSDANLINDLDKTSRKHLHATTAARIFMWRAFQNTKNNAFAYFFDVVLAPVIMLLIFNYLFGGAIAGSTEAYLQFLLPGILILTVIPMTVYSGTSICQDITKGVYKRFRTMPFWQPSAVLGPVITDGLRYTSAAIVAVCFGMLLGFRPEAGVIGMVSGILYAILFAFSVSWVFTMIGVIAKRPETVSGSSMIIIYPLLFGSNILVDSATMPKWIRVVVELNPISIASTAVRGLMNGTATTVTVIAGIGICLLFIFVFAPLTFYFYQKNR